MTTTATAPPGTGAAGRLAHALRPLAGGELPVRLRAWDGSEAGPADAPLVEVTSPRALRRLLWSPGELGAAQAYVLGEIEVPGDLDAALTHVWSEVRTRSLGGIRPTAGTLVSDARTALSLGVLGPRPEPPASQARLRGRRHSRSRDRAAISHHYDLSNAFYRLVLDDHMAYSSGYWTSRDPSYTLEDAQAAKLDLVCRKLGLDAGSRLLDVGCGWGSLSLHAAEHVGQDNYPTYVGVLHDAVRPGGRVLVQQMSRTGRHPGGGPFIESFIAPDMHMRPVGRTVDLIEAGGLEVRDVHAMREHYVWTVDAWLERFEDRLRQLRELVPEEVVRVWRLYLVGGRMAFRDGRMGVDQILAVRPGPHTLDPARSW